MAHTIYKPALYAWIRPKDKLDKQFVKIVEELNALSCLWSLTLEFELVGYTFVHKLY